MKHHVETLDLKCRKLKKDLEKSREDADHCQRSASLWKSRFMKLKDHCYTCNVCKEAAHAIFIKYQQHHREQQQQRDQQQQQQEGQK